MGTGFALALALGLLAAEPGAGEARETVRAPRTQYVDFAVADLEGKREGPSQTYVQGLPRAHFRSLVRVRGSFLPELQRSVDEL